MYKCRRTNIIVGTLAVAALLLWLYYWFFAASAGSGSITTVVEEHGRTREVVTYDWKQRYTPYFPLLIAGVFGAAVGAFVTFRTRKNPDRALFVFLIAPITAAVSAIGLYLLVVTIFYSDDSPQSHGIMEWVYGLLGAAFFLGIGIAIWTGIPAILGALAMSCFLNARQSEPAFPPPLPR